MTVIAKALAIVSQIHTFTHGHFVATRLLRLAVFFSFVFSDVLGRWLFKMIINQGPLSLLQNQIT